MENCGEPRDLNTRRSSRISARRAAGVVKPWDCSKCPCCRDDQAAHPASTAAPRPRKRKRSSKPRPATPSSETPWSRAVIAPADLPQVQQRSPRSQTASGDNQLTSTDAPITIHNCSVEEFQLIYHEVVDGMLKFKSGRKRPYSLELGRQIKQKLWERLGRPMTSSQENKNGLIHTDVTYGVGVSPPLYNVDISGEPKPECPPPKRAKSSH